MAIKSADPDLVFHLAAESHVDRSISGPRPFLESEEIEWAPIRQNVKQSTLHSFSIQ